MVLGNYIIIGMLVGALVYVCLMIYNLMSELRRTRNIMTSDDINDRQRKWVETLEEKDKNV